MTYQEKMVVMGMIDLYINKGWCRKRFAFDANGKCTETNDPNAASFCLVGAMRKIAIPMLKGQSYDVMHQLCIKLTDHLKCDVILWNDYGAKDKTQVIEMLKQVKDKL